MVHHPSGKVYIIELNAATGTLVDSLRLERHRPLQIKDGFRCGCSARLRRCAACAGAADLAFDSQDTLRRELCARVYRSRGSRVRRRCCTRRTRARALTQTLRLRSAPAARAGGSGAKRPREGAPPDDGRSVRASHVLIKHAGSRRPSSFREPVVTRTLEEAHAAIAALEARLAAGESMTAIAQENSHCSSAKRGGDLGVFGRGKMQRAFEEAAFALEVGQLSGPVETDSGVHLILRTQ